jgi:hypothetical protein
MAITAEWLAHGALHDNPGLSFHGIDDLRILKGVTLEAGARVEIQVLAGRATHEDGFEAVPVEMRSGSTLHARASIVLCSRLPEDRPAISAPARGAGFPASDVYSEGRLFHGPDFQGLEAVEEVTESGATALVKTAPPPAAWMRSPLRSTWIADPLVLDACFQLMILWGFEARGVGSLPTRIARYRQFRRQFPRDGARVTARVERQSEHAAEATIEVCDRAGSLVARIEGYECVLDASLSTAFARNQLAEQVGP